MKVIVSFFFISFSLLCFAQEQGDRPDRCHTNQYHEQMMQDPDFAEAHEQKMENIRQWLKVNKDESKMDCDEILYIPVAVHFQNSGGTSIGVTAACAEEMALSQIAAINADYAATNTDITKWEDSQGTWPGINNKESCIQFCLATLNHPVGSGIAEGDYAITIDEYDEIENIPEWSGYMNWYVRDMANPLGFSPLGGTGNGDGVVCGLPYFGTSNCNGTLSGQFNLGRTITHEVGHYLSLSHPFDSGDCVTDGDGVADTPLTDQATFGCFPDGEVIVNCTDPVLWPTYMEYCDDACLYMWTEDQVIQMEAHVNANLQNLLGNATTVCEDAACLGKDLNITVSQETCLNGTDGSIALQLVGGADPIEYSFNGGQSFQANSTLPNLAAGRYDVTVIDASGCELIDSVFLSREVPPIDITSITNSFCGNPDGSVFAEVDYPDVFEYNLGSGWQDTAFFDGLISGPYILSVRNDAGCTNNIDVVINDDTDLNLAIERIRPVNCPLFDNGLIDANLRNGVPPFEFRLNGEDPKPNGFYENLSTGLYTLSVEDQRGCKENYDFAINISFANIADDCPCEVFIPNAMTPGGNDALNNTFKPIPSCPITDYTFQVFNRWGDIVFESRNIEEVWNGGDGDYFGQNQLYFYKMTYRWGEERNESLELQQKTGFITVLR
ncbi:M43 family zinc metalloprotease [Cryomorphaceae bacterium 1068]|nr:M43 family zinc metalloprotease [Cryomorphaceae bacterium 1068]